METPYIEEDSMSDDEIFFEKITLWEIKKFFRKELKHHESKKTQAANFKDDSNLHLGLIETHSQPNLRSETADSPVFTSKPGSSTLGRSTDYSYKEMENMVSEFNNTAEFDDYILNREPNKVEEPVKKHDIEEENKVDLLVESLPIELSPKKQLTPAEKTLKLATKNCPQGKLEKAVNSKKPQPSTYYIPKIARNPPQRNITKNLPTVADERTEKTKVVDHKKALPGTTAIPTIVKNQPQKPTKKINTNPPTVAFKGIEKTKVVIKEVDPKKALPGTTAIPTIVINQPQKPTKKINTNPPTVAFKGIEKTKVVIKEVDPKKALPGTTAIPTIVKNQPQKPTKKINTNPPTVAFKGIEKTKVVIKEVDPKKALPGTTAIPTIVKNQPQKPTKKINTNPPTVAFKGIEKTKVVIKEVDPKKALPGTTAIPTIVKNQPQKPTKKINTNPPTVAFKGIEKTKVVDPKKATSTPVASKRAKKAKVVEIPCENKLPQSQCVKKITFNPRPTGMKHEKRVINPAKKGLLANLEDSLDMTCQQADVSLCTEKSAWKPL